MPWKGSRNVKKGVPYITLEGPFDEDSNSSISHLKNFVDVKDAFEFFGDLFHSAKVDFKNISAAQGKQIIQYISSIDYSSSFTMLYLLNCHGNMLDDLNTTFSTVTSLHFSTHPTEELSIRPDHKKLHEIFPNVNFLHIGHMNASHEWMYLREIQTDYLIVDVCEDEHEGNEANLAEFLQNNSCIVGLQIHNSSRRFLSKVMVFESIHGFLSLLGLSPNYSNYDVVNIQGIFTFNFKSNSENEIPDGINLHQIKLLRLEVPFNITNKWMEFLKNQVNTQLSMLQVKTESLNIEQLLEIARILPNLEEMHIDVQSHFAVNDIVEFLKESNKLKRLVLTSKSGISEANELAEKLEGQWTAKNDNLSGFFSVTTIERYIHWYFFLFCLKLNFSVLLLFIPMSKKNVKRR